jgi:hypothetical protein
MLRKLCMIGALCLAPLAGASAQTITIQQRPPAGEANAAPIRVQVSVNFFVQGPTNESEQANVLRDRARRSIYEMAAHECELLRDKLADDCRMESVNVNLNRQTQAFGGQPVEGFQVNGTFSYRISQKASVNP